MHPIVVECERRHDENLIPRAEKCERIHVKRRKQKGCEHMKYCETVENHYTEHWAAPIERIQWSKGPVADLPAGFQVLVIARTREMLAFATCCMSQPTDEFRLELHLFASFADANKRRRSLAELLTAVAHYHRTGGVLGLGHSVNFGKPWLPGSTCTHGIISLPYLDGPSLEYLEPTQTRFLWLIPVTAAEVKFKQRNGLEALEECFEKRQFDYLNPMRSSVV